MMTRDTRLGKKSLLWEGDGGRGKPSGPPIPRSHLPVGAPPLSPLLFHSHHKEPPRRAICS
ncbi:hypothetical protein BC939DRAFT_434372 [Gamsiella multidivaricata]|uniref:uncharacterized protein n=1 Tax=Gamsiella multidivaricata TaxID=101098 RepID=UPI00221E880F|nr:uncharacterized protein BC939DRAFT_434372 [Gamsiella multidivaricata]KAI7832785.1 hypothetical protein BC939DRAFT_434372 [Gamsiella multidivaricata]